MDHELWALSSDFHFRFLRVTSSSKRRLQVESKVSIEDREKHAVSCSSSSSSLVFNDLSRSNAKIGYFERSYFFDWWSRLRWIKKKKKKKKRRTNGGIFDGSWIRPSVLAWTTSFWLIEDISEILDAPSGPLFAFFSPSSVRIWNRKSFVLLIIYIYIYSSRTKYRLKMIYILNISFYDTKKKNRFRQKKD